MPLPYGRVRGAARRARGSIFARAGSARHLQLDQALSIELSAVRPPVAVLAACAPTSRSPAASAALQRAAAAATMSQSFGDDFGQRIDLAVRIREILRNYPEGTSIVKELVQNADDAGARTVAICVDARRHAARSCASAAAEELQGPALLCYNDALFREADFASIQRLGDSAKRSDATKTGRFGIGFNSVYHLTEVPSFASGSKVVWFDPQCAVWKSNLQTVRTSLFDRASRTR